MQSDRELLELAAKAAGLKIHAAHQAARDAMIDPQRASLWIVDVSTGWNPLTDDGDALRLVVKLKLHIGLESHTVSAWESDRFGNFQTENFIGRDENDATRRAIVRAAASVAQAQEGK